MIARATHPIALVAQLMTLVQLLFAQTSPDPVVTDPSVQMDRRSLTSARKLIDVSLEEELVHLAYSELPRPVRSRVYSSLGFILQEEARPFGTMTAALADSGNYPKVRVCAAQWALRSDLLEMRWRFGNQKIRALHRGNVVRLDLDLDEIMRNRDLDRFGCKEIDRVKGLIASMVRLKGRTHTVDPVPFQLRIPWPEELTDGVQFSSNPDQDLNGMDVYFWFKRVDAFVDGRKLSLQCYFKPGQRPFFEGHSQWFDACFRDIVLRTMQSSDAKD